MFFFCVQVCGDVMDHKGPTQPTSQPDLVHPVSLYSATATPTVHAVLNSLANSLTPAELEKEDAATPILSPPTGFREPDSQNNTAGDPMEDSFVNPLSLDVHRQQEHLSPGREVITGNTSSLSSSPRQQRYIKPVCTLSEHCSDDSTKMCHGNCQLDEIATLSPKTQPGNSVERCPVEVSTGVEVPPHDNSTLQEVEASTTVEVPPQDNSTLQEVEISTKVEVPPQDNSTLQEVEISTKVELIPQDSSTLQEDYKLLYHKALERIHLQAVELDRYRSLMSSVCEMAELKVCMYVHTYVYTYIVVFCCCSNVCCFSQHWLFTCVQASSVGCLLVYRHPVLVVYLCTGIQCWLYTYVQASSVGCILMYRHPVLVVYLCTGIQCWLFTCVQASSVGCLLVYRHPVLAVYLRTVMHC